MRATRLVPLSGVEAVTLIVAGSGAAGKTPKPDAPVGKLVSFYTAHDTRKKKPPVSRRFRSGSDGTRTRDLRRDRPAF